MDPNLMDFTRLRTTGWHLTNGEVKLALFGYRACRERIIAISFVRGVLADPGATQSAPDQDGPFGFDLWPVELVRKTIEDVWEKAPRRTDQLNAFRRELVLATANATRLDMVRLVLSLYTTLMERHAACAEQPDYLPDDRPSAAGQYVLRCLGVQAAYADLATYAFVLDQFSRVVLAIKQANAVNQQQSMADYLIGTIDPWPLDKTKLAFPKEEPPLALATHRPHVIAVHGPAQAEAPDEALLKCARQVGAEVAKAEHVIVSVGSPTDLSRSVDDRALFGASERGGKSIRIVPGDQPSWAPIALGTTPASPVQALTLAVPRKWIEDAARLKQFLFDVSDVSIELQSPAAQVPALQRSTRPATLPQTLNAFIEGKSGTSAKVDARLKHFARAFPLFLST